MMIKMMSRGCKILFGNRGARVFKRICKRRAVTVFTFLMEKMTLPMELLFRIMILMMEFTREYLFMKLQNKVSLGMGDDYNFESSLMKTS